MIERTIALIQEFLAAYGIPAVFLAGFLEEVIFFVPSSVVLLMAGFFLIDPLAPVSLVVHDALLMVALPAAAGITIGSLVIYVVVYAGGEWLVARYGRYLRVRSEDIERVRRRFMKGYTDEITLIVLRAIPAVSTTVVSAFCGLIRLPWREFVWTTFVGSFFRAFMLGLAGWYAGREYLKYAAYIATIERQLLVAAAVAMFVVGIVLFIRTRKT